MSLYFTYTKAFFSMELCERPESTVLSPSTTSPQTLFGGQNNSERFWSPCGVSACVSVFVRPSFPPVIPLLFIAFEIKVLVNGRVGKGEGDVVRESEDGWME